MTKENKQKKTLILTFGYGNNPHYESFISYLKEFTVDYVIDIRKSPRAWCRKWYGDQVHKLCVQEGINYLSVTALGNISGKSNWIPPDEKEATQALEKIAHQLKSKTILLLCAEKDYHKCHRLEVAIELQKLTHQSIHHLT